MSEINQNHELLSRRLFFPFSKQTTITDMVFNYVKLISHVPLVSYIAVSSFCECTDVISLVRKSIYNKKGLRTR